MFVRWEKLGTVYTAGAFITVYSKRNAKHFLYHHSLISALSWQYVLALGQDCISMFVLIHFKIKWLVFLYVFIVSTYWTMKYLGIYNRAMIDNHFIPRSNAVCRRTILLQCQTHSDIRFYMRVSDTFQVPRQLTVPLNKPVCWLEASFIYLQYLFPQMHIWYLRIHSFVISLIGMFIN